MYTLLHGDCLDALRTLPDCSVDSVVTDPPAGISFMGKAWDGDRGGRDVWVAWLAERLAECLRVLKPGGHAVVWALPRTSGWTHRALEDAGFEVRDCITHLFGSGFPKSLDVGKAIDKAAGAEREVVGRVSQPFKVDAAALRGTSLHGSVNGDFSRQVDENGYRFTEITAPATEAARQWDGWGTALKPAAEFWYLARKPFTGTVAQTVCEWGTGAINIDATRVPGVPPSVPQPDFKQVNGVCTHLDAHARNGEMSSAPAGRWPANVALTHPGCQPDGCVDGCPAAELDRQSGVLSSGGGGNKGNRPGSRGWFGLDGGGGFDADYQTDRGGASRFFQTFRYQAKPSTREKNAGCDYHLNRHPTVKPVELLRWLTRLVTPPGGTVLDCFAGSGTVGVAATLERFDNILIEAEAEYLPIIEARMAWAVGQTEQLELLEAD